MNLITTDEEKSERLARNSADGSDGSRFDRRQGYDVPEIHACRPQGRPRILLVANTAWYIHNFRLNLVRHLQDLGAVVSVVAPRDDYADLLVAEGYDWIEWQVDRRGINPLNEVGAVARLRKIYAAQQPDVIHHFTIKCVIYGTAASRGLRNCKVVNTVTGLGHLFLSNSLRCRIARPVVKNLYRWAMTRKNVCSMFQNEDDAKLLLGKRHVKRVGPIFTLGSGVDLQQFAPADDCDAMQTATAAELDRPVRVMFVGRVVAQKGIAEFVEAARLVHERGLNVEFIACGDRDHGNRSVVDDETFANWGRNGDVQFLGHQDNMASMMRTADIVVLPSYREGTPRTLMEASAMGKPIVSTDVPGSRNVAFEGENALLVPPRDAGALASAVARLVEDPELRYDLGEGGRELALQYDVRHVNEQIVRAYAAFDPREVAWTDETSSLAIDAELAQGV